MSLADDFGEEPARFLARSVPGSLETMEARIRGLQTVGDVDEWIECELAIGPRQRVVAALNQRREELR